MQAVLNLVKFLGYITSENLVLSFKNCVFLDIILCSSATWNSWRLWWVVCAFILVKPHITCICLSGDLEVRGGSLLPISALQSSCWCLCRHWNEGKICVGLCPCLMRSCPASSHHQHIQWLTGCQFSHFLSSLALDVRRISMKSWICLQFLFWVPGVWHTHSPFFGVNCSHVVYMENSQDSFCSVFRQDFF